MEPFPRRPVRFVNGESLMKYTGANDRNDYTHGPRLYSSTDAP
jgi:hypothetical protein